MVEPKRAHWAAAKHVLRYLQGTIDYGLLYSKGKDIRVSGFTDADCARNSVDWKSTSGYCVNIGSRITSWCRRKQKSVVLSSSKAKYMAASTTLCEAIWLRNLLVNLFRRNMEATKIMCDNQSCIKLSDNPVFHDRSRHIDIQCHFAKDCVQRGTVQLSYTPTGEQVADILTKALGKSKFDYFREKMGMWSVEQSRGNKYGIDRWEISAEEADTEPEVADTTQSQKGPHHPRRGCRTDAEAQRGCAEPQYADTEGFRV
eukprot:PITA_36696